MLKVNNKKAINNLAFSGIKSNRKKYAVLVLAVILTTLLFSSLFTIGGSMLKEVQLSTMRQVGGSTHAGLKYLSLPEYEMIKDDSKLKDISYRIIVGIPDDERLLKTRTEVNYYEPENAKSAFCYPEVGTMPEKENEIVLSDLTLDALGVPHEVGAKLSMSMKIGDKSDVYDFVLCGYYRGDPISTAQMGLVSKAFQEKYAPTKVKPLTEYDYNDYVGWISADFDFNTSFNIEKQTLDLIERTGIRDDVEYGINWAYAGSRVDPSMSIVCGLLLATFFAAGYLIIYNIFYLNIISDMQEYGLLKTIGTTGKQLKKIVLRRATLVSIIGIPIGLAVGVGIGALLLPVISNEFSTVSFDKGALHMNIWIIIGAALFSYLTVIISATKPCKKASMVSPIEARKYTEARGKDGKPKKKMALVVMSLSLSIIVLIGVYAFITGFSMDSYVGNMIISDFSVQGADLDNPAIYDKNMQGVSENFLVELNKQEGIESVGNVYIDYGSGTGFDDETWERVKEDFFGNDVVRKVIADHNRDIEDFDVDWYLESFEERKSIQGNTYGLSKACVDKLDVIQTIDGGDKIDWEKFNSGKYVLLVRFYSDDADPINFAKPGDKVKLESHDKKYAVEKNEVYEGQSYSYTIYENAPVKEYEVYGIVDIPYPMGLQMYSEFNCDCILPEDEFHELNGDWDPMRTIINVDADHEEEMDKWLETYTTNDDASLSYKSKDSIVEEYKSFGNMVGLVGSVMSFILGLIGLLNFSNTIITSILVRSREFAMLEAVGMTGKQQKKQLIKEGFVYFVWTAVVSAVLGTIIDCTLIRALVDGIMMFKWHFTLTPLVICLPILCIMVIVIPVLAYGAISKKSVIDRLRVE